MKKILTILLLTFIGITSAYAQLVNTDSNTRTLKFILSTGPGSGTDSAIETYALCLRNQNINIVKEFKPGAEGFIAIQALQQSRDTPQLTNILVGNFGLNMLGKFPGINLLEDIHPLTYTNSGPVVIAGKKDRFKSIQDLRELSKKRPINIGSTFISGTYIAEQLFTELQIPYQIIPYKNNVNAITDILNGSLDLTSDTFMGTKALIEGDRLDIFTSTLDKRTATKYNHNNIEKYSTKLGKMPLGIVLSSNPTLSNEQKNLVVNAIQMCNREKEIVEKLEKIGSNPIFMSTEEIRQLIKQTSK
jgi:tripartite-type tricarboxylate transporter receptor subunit TctC